MKPELTVIIPTFNPRTEYLSEVVAALRDQTLSSARWELVIVDNKSQPPLAGRVDIAWHPRSRIVREESLGLTNARIAGFACMNTDVAVLVDDDNVLSHDYLERTLSIAARYTFLGAWGGAIVPRFETPASAPPPSLFPLLTLRSVDHDVWSNDTQHNASTPWGAGLCVRREVALEYSREVSRNTKRSLLDLQGTRLLYGGDTDIVFTACAMGLGKGVFASLRVNHLIPASRCSVDYLTAVADGRGYSEILHAFTLGIPVQVKRISLFSVLSRWYRLGGMQEAERATALAHERGRRRAMRELSRGSRTEA
jgi:hypothetical protein